MAATQSEVAVAIAGDTETADRAMASDIQQLWELSLSLARQNLTQQAAQCLEECAAFELCSLCRCDCITNLSPEEQSAAANANTLLAEMCVVACSNERKSKDRELWRRRVVRAERCVASVDAMLQEGVACPIEWELRLLKVKFHLAQYSKGDRSTKNRRVLETLCAALVRCSEAGVDGANTSTVQDFRRYFGVQLKASIVKVFAATTNARSANHAADSDQFLAMLKYLRANLSDHVDKQFLLWLVEISCHAASTSSHLDNGNEIRQLVTFGDELFRSVQLEKLLSPEFHVYHLILRGFYFQRTGEIKRIKSLIDEIEAVGLQSADGETTKEDYVNTIVDSLRLTVVACSDPCQAMTLSMSAIHTAQTNLGQYQSHPAVRVLLIATLFDMLYLHCQLQSQQCRYFEMGVGISQMVEIFAGYKEFLLPTVYYRFFLARIHMLIAKYATAIGKIKQACSHLNYIVSKLLPSLDTDDDSYPDVYLVVWVGVLEIGTYCCTIEAESSDDSVTASPVTIQQVVPNKVLLEWTARVLERPKLCELVYNCSNAELRSKYDLALAKWLWATQELAGIPASSSRSTEDHPLTPHRKLEVLRPTAQKLVRGTLERVSASVNSCEMTAEIMALFGPMLVAFGKLDSGEETLKNALRLSLHSKNVLLQTRLLVDIFQLYRKKRATEAQAATAAKYEKKRAVLQRRVALAQAESTTNSAILRWTSGGSGSDASPKVKST